MNAASQSPPIDPSVLKSAFDGLLDQQQLDTAIRLLRESYSGKTGFSVQYYVRECCAVLGIESQRSQMVQNLVKEINHRRRQKLMTSGATPVDSAGNEAALVVFQTLFRTMTDSAGPIRSREIVRYVHATMDTLSLAKDVRVSLVLWLNGTMPVIEANVPVPVMTHLINRVYVGLCEYCGPVKADQLLHESVSTVASTPAGKVFHPNRLL